MAAVLSFFTVLLAAHGPAKQVAKILPIEAVRGEQYSISMKKGEEPSFPDKGLRIPW